MEEPLLAVAAVARRLGVAPATLRTWARRYGLGPSGHAAGSHRRYSAADISRLEAMRRLTLQGVPPAAAAAAALRASTPGADEHPASAPGHLRPDGSKPAIDGESGARVLAVADAGAEVSGLARAAMALDRSAVIDQLRRALFAAGVAETWESLLAPVLVAVGERWAATGDGVDVEHLLAGCASGVLREYAGRLDGSVNARPVVLACVAGELHSLPLDVLAAALAERRIAAHVLGGAVPARALASVVRRIGPAALFVWSQLPATGDPAQLAAVPVTRPAVAVIAGGPGWDPERLPRRCPRATDLRSAVELVSRAAGT